MNNIEYVKLFNRELNKLRNEIAGYSQEDKMWIVLPGTINSGGNLAQHLIGNLRTYIGLTLGNEPYIRNRVAEFGERLFTQESLLTEIDILQEIVHSTIEKLSDEELQKEYSHEVLTIFPEQSVSFVLTHLLMHLSYHTGQINYHRRFTNTINN